MGPLCLLCSSLISLSLLVSWLLGAEEIYCQGTFLVQMLGSWFLTLFVTNMCYLCRNTHDLGNSRWLLKTRCLVDCVKTQKVVLLKSVKEADNSHRQPSNHSRGRQTIKLIKVMTSKSALNQKKKRTSLTVVVGKFLEIGLNETCGETRNSESLVFHRGLNVLFLLFLFSPFWLVFGFSSTFIWIDKIKRLCLFYVFFWFGVFKYFMPELSHII